MKKKVIIALSVIAVIVIAVLSSPDHDETNTEQQTTAEITSFSVDREFAQFVFTLEITNTGDQEITVYAVVYGKNDSYVPPRRGAWPMGGILFSKAGTKRGQLRASDIRKDWEARPENAKGAKITVQPGITDTLEGALPINETSPHRAWQGQRLDPNSMYNEVSLWIYSEAGKTLLRKTYNI